MRRLVFADLKDVSGTGASVVDEVVVNCLIAEVCRRHLPQMVLLPVRCAAPFVFLLIFGPVAQTARGVAVASCETLSYRLHAIEVQSEKSEGVTAPVLVRHCIWVPPHSKAEVDLKSAMASEIALFPYSSR